MFDSPLEAYRRDLARRSGGAAFGTEDGRWILAAMLLRRLPDAPDDERPEIAAQLATHLAIGAETTAAAAGLSLASEMEEAGALHLATTWLALLERLVHQDRLIDLGRILGQRARLCVKLGEMDAARRLYEEVAALGEACAEPELTARAWSGYGFLAQMRGDHLEALRWLHVSALLSDDMGCAEQAFRAHQGIMVINALSENYDTAIVEGWRAFVACGGRSEWEAEVLTNIAQLLHDTGQHATALRGFAAIVSRTTLPHVLFPALGGAALAAAALGNRSVVDAAAERVERLTGSGWAYPHCDSLADLAQAYALLGDQESAARYSTRARQMALAHSYDMVLRRLSERPVAAATRVQRPIALSGAAARVISVLAVLDVPEDLRLAS